MTDFLIQNMGTIHWGIAIIFSILTLYYPIYAKKKHGSESIQSGAVSLGILGTFFGVALGLLTFKFSPTEMESSIELLIGGLKTAFITPVVGLLVSLLVKHTNLYKIKEDIEDKSEAGMLIHLLRAIEKNSESVNRMSNSISGDGDTTLYTQIQKLRTGMLDKQEELNEAFKNFAEKMADNNTKALIDAIREVIGDFNNKLNEQFGENFKHLNEGVGRMLDWQKEYKDSIEDNINIMREVKETMSESANSMKSLSVSAAEISESSSVMIEVAKSVKESINNLEKELDEFGSISERAKETFDSQVKSFDGMKDIYRDAIKIMSTNHEEYVKEMAKQRDSFRTMSDQIIKDNNSELNKIRLEFSKLSESLSKQVLELDKQLGEELTKSIGTLGRQLTSLSGKFVEDYSVLSTRLSEIMRSLNK